MATKTIALIFIAIFAVEDSQQCKPLWANDCQSNSDCCSGYCYKGENNNWGQGLCKEGGGGGGNPNPPPSPPGGATESGQCSWYGEDGEIPDGHPTACNHPFNPRELKTAHRTLPCGTRLRVTNSANGQSVEVTVDDRGPFVAGRILDLTKAAFGRIAEHGKGVIDCSYVTL